MTTIELRYLSGPDVEALGMTDDEILGAIEGQLAAQGRGETVGFVPTMGAFHQGHLSLMRQAKKATDAVIVSIFVNPLQFAAGEDYDRYPRQMAKDLRMAESEKVDVLFAPSVAGGM